MIKPKNYGGGRRRRPGRAYKRELGEFFPRSWSRTARDRRARLREKTKEARLSAEIERLREEKASPKLTTPERLQMASRMRSKRAQLKAWRKQSRWQTAPIYGAEEIWIGVWYTFCVLGFIGVIIYRIMRAAG